MSREIQHDLHNMEFDIQSKHQGLRRMCSGILCYQFIIMNGIAIFANFIESINP